MDQKTTAIVSYLTIIGWVIAFVLYNSNSEKGSLARYHLRQSFGVHVSSFALQVGATILVPLFGLMAYLLFVVVFAMWVLGFIAAIQGEEKPIPYAGDYFQRWFSFIQ